MAVNLLADKGTPIDQQKFTWKDLVQKPISKMNVDAFTRAFWKQVVEGRLGGLSSITE